jgi:hypothetical protein
MTHRHRPALWIAAIAAAALVAAAPLAAKDGVDDNPTGDDPGATSPTTPTTPVAPGTAPRTSARICRGTIGAVYVSRNIVVPVGATCVLNGTRTDGGVSVRARARLVMRNVDIDDGIVASGYRSVVIRGGAMDGVRLRGGRAATLIGANLDGPLVSVGNRGRQVFQGNRIDGNLRCTGNLPAPTGGGNTVDGARLGQCARL